MAILYKGDCLEQMKKIEDGTVDMILCDLPYAITDCKWDVLILFDKLWTHYKRVVKEDGAVCLFGNQPFTTEIINSNRKDFRYAWYWVKNNVTGFCFSKSQPMRCVEDVCVFYAKKPSYNPQGITEIYAKHRIKKHTEDCVYNSQTLLKPYKKEFTNFPINVMYFENDAHINRLHPTQKPVRLLEYLTKTYTNAGDVVLDNCMGSGSTGVACANTGRNFIGIEKDNAYFLIAENRIHEAEALSKSSLFSFTELEKPAFATTVHEPELF